MGDTTTFGYTGGILSTVTDPAGNTSTMLPDSAGRIIQQTDALGNSTFYTYDNLDRLGLSVANSDLILRCEWLSWCCLNSGLSV